MEGKKGSMKLLLVSPEVDPFSKTGGLGDVAGALPRVLSRRGHDVAVVTPLYRGIRKMGVPLTPVMNGIEAEFGGKSFSGSLQETHFPETDVPVYLVDCPPFYDRDGLYGENGKDYADNLERFAFLCQVALRFAKEGGFRPDVIHLHDWQSALVAVYLRTLHRDDPFFTSVRTLYTIHNLAYQGLFPSEKMEELRLPWDVYHIDGLEFYGKISLMKGGIAYSDKTSTVSERYAEEIQTEEFGCGLEGLLSKRSAHLVGILNGVDYTDWDPATDKHLPARYQPDDLSGKAVCKEELQKENGLPVKMDIPLIGVVTRLTEQKGLDLVVRAFDRLMDLGFQFVLLGTGDPEYHEAFKELGRQYPNQASIHLTFDNAMAHRIEAGADLFLMPSRYEPCGLNQMYSLRYGTVPVVRETGGLADTIDNYHITRKTGNGFVFRKAQPGQLVKAVRRALTVYNDRKAWRDLMKRAMLMDFSWERAAQRYEEVFAELVRRGN
jgi:starch synthase